MLVAALICLMILIVLTQTTDDHPIAYLPGYKDGRTAPPFKSYTGYLRANETTGRHLFYWFLESQRNPSKDPLIVWVSTNDDA